VFSQHSGASQEESRPCDGPAARIIASRLALVPGTRLGPYEILSPLGAGGMGEVYKARDTKLNRDVALKVLPGAFTADPERLARFKREAHVLASLNHPNIAAIYGLEDSDGVRALVLELVDGPTLADRIAQGPIPLDEALRMAKDIAQALEAAHEQGIVHRDLKPANIKVRDDGTVKVLDFGLAKAMEPAGMPSANVSMSPTITSPAMTQMGLILGTAAYMSPEQARGRLVDKRSDVWAFGCVVFEMLTGRRAFDGDDVSITLAAVLKSEPDWRGLASTIPPSLGALLQRCLENDPKDRLRDIGEARIAIAKLMNGVRENETRAGLAANPAASRWAWPLAVVMVATAAAAVVFSVRARPSTPQPLERLAINLPAGAAYVGPTYGPPAISRDGTRIAYVAQSGARRMAFIRSMDDLEPHAVAGTEGAVAPFFSPDGRYLGFFSTISAGASSSAVLKKVAVGGGTAITICPAPNPFGGTWTVDGRIVFASSSSERRSLLSLQVINDGGGVPRAIDLGDIQAPVVWPDVLPDGRHIIFSVQASFGGGEPYIGVVSIDGGAVRKVVASAFQARFVPTGDIVYAARGSLFAMAFDPNALTTRGEPLALVENVDAGPVTGTVPFAVSDTGVLVYVPGGGVARTPQRTLVWVDRHGRETPLSAPARAYTYPRIAPDGSRVALDIRDQAYDIWALDLARGSLSRLTTFAGADSYPVWMPGGRELLFASNREGPINLYRQPADGTGVASRVITSGVFEAPQAVSPDGRQAVVRHSDPLTGDDLMLVSLDGSSAPRVVPLVKTKFVENNADISPDGKWVAYQSDESGQFEVYVRPFPDAASARWLASAGGGTRPVWSRSGTELFYVVGSSPDPIRMMRVAVATSPSLTASRPQQLFEGHYYIDSAAAARGRTYDVSPDGSRFLMIKDDPRQSEPMTGTSLNVILHALEHLK